MESDRGQTGILERCLEWFKNSPEDQQEWIKGLSKRDLVREHLGLGLTVRNLFIHQPSPEQT
jgi:hypothetical protein